MRVVEIERELATVLERAGYQAVHVFDELDSTMNAARELARELSPQSPFAAGLVLANRQSQGRGRQGRQWQTTAGAFLGSFVICGTVPPARFEGFSLAVGVEVAEVLRQLGANPRLKWPNDVLVRCADGSFGKIAGILIELVQVERTHAVIIGIGVNLGAEPVPGGASLAQGGGRETSVLDFATEMAPRILSVYREYSVGNSLRDYKGRWEALSILNGRNVRFENGDAGRCSGVADNGALILDSEHGTIEVSSGHIVEW